MPNAAISSVFRPMFSSTMADPSSSLAWVKAGLYSAISPPFSMIAELYSSASSSGVLSAAGLLPQPDRAVMDRARARTRVKIFFMISPPYRVLCD